MNRHSEESERRPCVVLFMPGLRSLTGGGGTERFFADFFTYYRRRPDSRYRLIMLTDSTSLEHLRAVGRRADGPCVLGVRPAAGPFSLLFQAFDIARVLGEAHAALVHVSLPSLRYLPALWLLVRLRVGRRAKMCATLTDCTVAHAWDDRALRRDDSVRRAIRLYRAYFAFVRLDGVFSWYRAFERRARTISIRGTPVVRSARFCFTDTEEFRPTAKEQVVVWSGRLVASKRPQLFIDAIAALVATDPGLIRDWRVEMFGKGPLESALRERIAARGLDEVIHLSSAGKMAPILGRSQIFVSTQDFENFTSLAMLEAMAAGCAIVARDLGQTREFVSPGENGVLAVDPCSPAKLADSLASLMRDSARVRRFGERSRRIAVEHHCAENFSADIEAFWKEVLDRHSDE